MEPKNKSDREVTLGQILAAQSIMHALPSKEKLGEFFLESLRFIPGIKSTGLCIKGFLKPLEDSEGNCQNCSNLEQLTSGKKGFSCGLVDKEGVWVLPLETSFQLYGFVQIKKIDKQFEDYESIIHNFTNMLAITIENQWQHENLRKTNIALRKSEQKFKKYFELPLIGVAIFDAEGRWIELNDRMCEIVGYSREELMGFVWTDVTHTDDIAPCIKLIDEVKEKKIDQYTVEKKYFGKNGEITPVEASVGCMRNKEGIPEFYVALVQDISIRKRSEKELENSLKRSKSYFEAPLVGLLVSLPEKGFIEVNDRICEMTGYSRDELLRLTWVDLTHPDDIQKDTNLFLKVYSGEIERYNLEKRYIKKDGTIINVEISVGCVRLDDGSPDYFVAVILDTTERKKYESELILSQKQLIHAEKLAALGRLTGSIAHEFNNPLQGVRNILDILEGSDLTEEKMELAVLAGKECDRMADMIRDLRSFYKPTSYKASSICINKCIEEVIVLQMKSLLLQDIKIKRQLYDDLPKIEVVEDQIKQVILNLIQNASDAMPGGGQITLITELRSSHIMIKIQDTGSGISEDGIKVIFDPFYTTKGIKGTGLGLSISYGIIKDHGGSILVTSEQGRGATFSISIPIQRSKTPMKSEVA